MVGYRHQRGGWRGRGQGRGKARERRMYGRGKGAGGGAAAAAGEVELSLGHQWGGGGGGDAGGMQGSQLRTPPGTHLHGCMLGTSSKAINRTGRRTALPSTRACSGVEAMTCLATPRQRVVDRSRIAFSMKNFVETDPIPAAYSAISFSNAKASGPARPYVS